MEKKENIINKQQARRQLAFKLIAVSLPVILVIIVELGLTAIHYGYNTSLFIEDPQLPGYCKMNPEVGRRFFTDIKNVPLPTNEPFKREKSPGTIRLFVMGESTAIGYPYMNNGSFHRMLKYRLERTYPGRDIELINLALTAVNSYALLSFTSEVAKMQADAVLMYVGHNEYYGALGLGSNQRFGSSRLVIKTFIFARHFRLVQLAFNTYNWFRHLFVPGGKPVDNSLMKKMAGKQEIPYGSKIYEGGLLQFEKNMAEILHEFQEKHIPVFLSDIVSNERGQKPFISKLQASTDSASFYSGLKNGKTLLDTNQPDEAKRQFESLQKIDSTNALNNFYLADSYYALENYPLAKKYYANSKELDALRFRAPEAINSIIRNLARKYTNVTFVDVRQKFLLHAQYGIFDNKLFTEHLHPTLDGYFHISDAFYESIVSSGIIGKPANFILAEAIQKELPVTAVDTIFGKFEVYMLRENWPFLEKTEWKNILTGSLPENLVKGLYANKLTWPQAMFQLYDYYLKEGNEKEALRVVKGISLQLCDDWRISYHVASLCLKSNDLKEAKFYFEKTLKQNPDQQTRAAIRQALAAIGQKQGN
jgi:tetratricopeptide (TPR) repeat protein